MRSSERESEKKKNERIKVDFIRSRQIEFVAICDENVHKYCIKQNETIKINRNELVVANMLFNYLSAIATCVFFSLRFGRFNSVWFGFGLFSSFTYKQEQALKCTTITFTQIRFANRRESGVLSSPKRQEKQVDQNDTDTFVCSCLRANVMRACACACACSCDEA